MVSSPTNFAERMTRSSNKILTLFLSSAIKQLGQLIQSLSHFFAEKRRGLKRFYSSFFWFFFTDLVWTRERKKWFQIPFNASQRRAWAVCATCLPPSLSLSLSFFLQILSFLLNSSRSMHCVLCFAVFLNHFLSQNSLFPLVLRLFIFLTLSVFITQGRFILSVFVNVSLSVFQYVSLILYFLPGLSAQRERKEEEGP